MSQCGLSPVCFLNPFDAPAQSRGRMVDKLIKAGGWGMMCVSLLPNSTNLLDKQLKRLLCERVNCTMMSFFTDSARSPPAKRRLTRLNIPVLLKKQISFDSSYISMPLKRSKTHFPSVYSPYTTRNQRQLILPCFLPHPKERPV